MGDITCNKWHLQGHCFEKCEQKSAQRNFTDDSLKQAYAKWAKEVKDKSPHKASWWLGQAEVKLDSVVSIDNKLNHEFSMYLSYVPNQKAAATLVPTRLDIKFTKMQDRPHTRQKKMQECQNSSQQGALLPTTKWQEKNQRIHLIQTKRC